MPYRLLALGDILNSGKNQLIIIHPQSQPEPSHYDLLCAEDGAMSLERSMVLDDGRVWELDDYWSQHRLNQGDESTHGGFVTGDLFTFRPVDETYVFVNYWGGHLDVGGGVQAVIRLEGNAFEVLEVIPDDILLPYSNRPSSDQLYTFWFDLTGSGKGLLRVAYRNPYFLFYALK
jgi:hypothetical protein